MVTVDVTGLWHQEFSNILCLRSQLKESRDEAQLSIHVVIVTIHQTPHRINTAIIQVQPSFMQKWPVNYHYNATFITTLCTNLFTNHNQWIFSRLTMRNINHIKLYDRTDATRKNNCEYLLLDVCQLQKTLNTAQNMIDETHRTLTVNLKVLILHRVVQKKRTKFTASKHCYRAS